MNYEKLEKYAQVLEEAVATEKWNLEFRQSFFNLVKEESGIDCWEVLERNKNRYNVKAYLQLEQQADELRNWFRFNSETELKKQALAKALFGKLGKLG